MISPVIQRTFDFYGGVARNARTPASQGDLMSERELFLIKALFGYAKGKGVFGRILMALHRVWNALKALFGQSDWQKGRRAVLNVARRITPGITDRNIAEKFKNLTEKKVSIFLERCLAGVNALNKALKPFEDALYPLLDQYLEGIGQKGVDLGVFALSLCEAESIEMLIEVFLKQERPRTADLREDLRQILPLMIPSIKTNLVNKGFPIELLA